MGGIVGVLGARNACGDPMAPSTLTDWWQGPSFGTERTGNQAVNSRRPSAHFVLRNAGIGPIESHIESHAQVPRAGDGLTQCLNPSNLRGTPSGCGHRVK